MMDTELEQRLNELERKIEANTILLIGLIDLACIPIEKRDRDGQLAFIADKLGLRYEGLAPTKPYLQEIGDTLRELSTLD